MGTKGYALFRSRVSAPGRAFPTGCQREGAVLSSLEVPRSLVPRKEEEEENTALGATPSILKSGLSPLSDLALMALASCLGLWVDKRP